MGEGLLSTCPPAARLTCCPCCEVDRCLHQWLDAALFCRHLGGSRGSPSKRSGRLGRGKHRPGSVGFRNCRLGQHLATPLPFVSAFINWVPPLGGWLILLLLPLAAQSLFVGLFVFGRQAGGRVSQMGNFLPSETRERERCGWAGKGFFQEQETGPGREALGSGPENWLPHPPNAAHPRLNTAPPNPAAVSAEEGPIPTHFNSAPCQAGASWPNVPGVSHTWLLATLPHLPFTSAPLSSPFTRSASGKHKTRQFLY